MDNDLQPEHWQTALDNMGLVWFVVNRYRWTTTEDRANAVQNGVIGLATAAKRFKPEKGSFSTYAVYWIKREVFRGIGTEGGINLRRAAANGETLESELSLDEFMSTDDGPAADVVLADATADTAHDAEFGIMADAVWAACRDACRDALDRDIVAAMENGGDTPLREHADNHNVSGECVRRRTLRLRRVALAVFRDHVGSPTDA